MIFSTKNSLRAVTSLSRTYNLSHEQCGFRFTNNEKCIIRGSSTHREHISRSTASEPGEFQRPLTSLRLAKDRIREQFVRMYRELIRRRAQEHGLGRNGKYRQPQTTTERRVRETQELLGQLQKQQDVLFLPGVCS